MDLILLGTAIGIIIWALYAFIKKAVKDALREYDAEKNKPSVNE